MATKSKNTDEKEVTYEEMVKDFKKIKIARTLGMFFLAMMIAIVWISAKDISVNRNIFNEKSMYRNNYMGSEISTFKNNVLIFSELYKNESYIKEPKNIRDEELKYKKNEIKSKIQSEYEERLSELHQSSYGGDVSETKYNEEKEKLRKSIEEKYNKTDEELKALLIEEKLLEYERYKNLINSYVNLNYIVYDKENGLWFSNYGENQEAIENLRNESGYLSEYHINNGNVQESITINGEIIRENDLDNYRNNSWGENSIHVPTTDYYSNGNYYHEEYTNMIITTSLDVYIGVKSDIVYGDSLYNIYNEFNKAKTILDNQTCILFFSILGGIVVFFILKKMKSKSNYIEKLEEKLKELTIEINLLILIMTWLTTKMLFRYNWGSNCRNTIYIGNIILYTLFMVVVYSMIRALYSKYKEGDIFKNSYLIKFYDNFRVSLEKKTLGRKLITILSIYIIGCTGVFLLFVMGFDSAGAILAIGIILVATAVVLFVVSRDFAYLNKIAKGAKNMSDGISNENLPEQGKGSLRDLAHSINNMKDGLISSIENETKSERMKSELITNVSHDLKTPLTSIINYVDLLKRIDVNPEEAKVYVEVLDKKSQRLKVLIEDLFEASKAASGSMQLNLEKLDVIALLNQTLGEAEGRIKAANLNFKIKIPKKKIYVNADGRKLWRVFENLINNIIKYSLEGTRVYIDLNEVDGKVIITFKNISANELNFDPEEITERFKRGEDSRNTEGSGLGLAIAKSIVELHGGKFNIGIEGDLFKADIYLDIV